MCVEGHHCLPSIRAKVLDVVGFVEDHIMPLPPLERVDILQNQLVACYAHVERVLLHPAFPFLLSFILIAVVGQNFEAWTELLEFHLPIENDTCRHNDQVRTPDFMLDSEMC